MEEKILELEARINLLEQKMDLIKQLVKNLDDRDKNTTEQLKCHRKWLDALTEVVQPKE